jgi:transaldolase
MKIFLDTALIEEIEEVKSYGILNGVTTNPSKIKQAVEKLQREGKKVNIRKYIKRMCRLCHKIPISLEVVGSTSEEMIEEGKRIYRLFNRYSKRVYVKIPVNPMLSKEDTTAFDGLKAIAALSKRKIPVNATLIFTPEQALLAARAGAKILSPFSGREDDYIRAKSKMKFKKTDYFQPTNKTADDNGIIAGRDLVEQCASIVRQHEIDTEVLAASIRNPRQLRDAALRGAHIATTTIDVLRQSLMHPKTLEGMQKFTDDITPEYLEVVHKKSWFG